MSGVIYHEELGIYLGCCMGMGFWSKLGSVGQSAAVTFINAVDAEKHVHSWEQEEENQVQWADCKFVVVPHLDKNYATLEECVRVGLPPWLDDMTETKGMA